MANPNCSFILQEETLNNLRILSRLSGKSINQTVNEVLQKFVAKFSAEISEFENFAQTAARKVQEKITGDNVSKIFVKWIHTDKKPMLAAFISDKVLCTVEIDEVDKGAATDFLNGVFPAIGNNAYEIQFGEKLIVITIGEQTLRQNFSNAQTAEKIAAFVDDVIEQTTKQAFPSRSVM